VDMGFVQQAVELCAQMPVELEAEEQIGVGQQER
jgi:hypothetical protein